MFRLFGWYWFDSENEDTLISDKSGKWMHFFTNQETALEICQRAIDEGVCDECKCRDMEFTEEKEGVICFYINADDLEAHRRVIQFMMDNNLIQKTKAGRYYNISFKFDNQTRAGEYGASFEGKITLDHFIDLWTGEWII